MRQYPGVRMAPLENWGTGGTGTTLRGYFDVARLRGISKEDLRENDYRGFVQDVSGNYVDPLLKLLAGAYVVRTDGGSALPANTRVTFNVETTYLVEFNNPSSVAVN